MVRRLINRLIKRVVEAPTKTPRRRVGSRAAQVDERQGRERKRQRSQTLGSVLRSSATVVIFTIAGVIILGQLGIQIGPIIAGAGVIGVAIGFGAQNLVSDFLAGMLMLAEDQLGVGDWVDIDGTVGAVEEVQLRVTKLRDMDGSVWYIRNGQILKVCNYSQDWACTVLDVPVPYDSDIDATSRLLERTAWSLWDDDAFRGYVLDTPQIWGIQSLSREAVTLRISVNTVPLKQWAIGRELRRRIKDAFDQQGVHLPHLQQTVWVHPQDATGSDTTPASETLVTGDGEDPANR